MTVSPLTYDLYASLSSALIYVTFVVYILARAHSGGNSGVFLDTKISQPCLDVTNLGQ